MNQGLPNISNLSIKLLLSSFGINPILGWVLQKILSYFLTKGTQKLLVIADGQHVAFLVRHDGKEWNKSMDGALQIVDSGKLLTQEEKDAIDKPVMDAFLKLATFRVSNNGKHS